MFSISTLYAYSSTHFMENRYTTRQLFTFAGKAYHWGHYGKYICFPVEYQNSQNCKSIKHLFCYFSNITSLI